VAHEWLVAYAGSERCVEQMLEVFPGAELLTTLVRPDAIPEAFAGARPSVLQRIPGASAHHEWLLPLMPLAWRLHRGRDDVDAVISSSHACAKAVPLPEGAPHLCYCHTPMRYAWDFGAEKDRFPRPIRPAARLLMSRLRAWDRGTADRVTAFVANSRAVAGRIRASYGRTAQVIHPPVDTEYFTPGGERSGRFLYVGRLVGYKRAGLVIEAFRGLPFELTVIGSGQDAPALRANLPSNVTMIDHVTKEALRDHLRSATALVYPADEDFGIVMAEAQACGTPVVGVRSGGALDIVADGETGWLVQAPTVDEVRRAVRAASTHEADPWAISASAERFSSRRFRAEIQAAVAEMVDTSRRTPLARGGVHASR
jgi:glycosyltransferase involved in cell wall biosynthesis